MKQYTEEIKNNWNRGLKIQTKLKTCEKQRVAQYDDKELQYQDTVEESSTLLKTVSVGIVAIIIIL